MKIAFLAFEGFEEETRLVGPWDVFNMAAAIRTRPFSNVLILTSRRPLRASTGLVITPNHRLDETPQAETLLAPGGRGLGSALHDEQFIEWGTTRSRASVTSMCAVALPKQVSGLINRRRITTQCSRNAQVRENGRDNTVVEGVRNVRDSNEVPRAGMSEDINIAHWLVARDCRCAACWQRPASD